MQQAPPKSLSTAAATPRLFAPDPSMRGSLASSMVAAGTVGAGAEMSPRIAVVGIATGGWVEGMVVVHRLSSPEVARNADTRGVDGLRSAVDPYLYEQRCIVPADPPPGTSKRRG